MRAIFVLILSGAFLVGCQHPKPAESSAVPGETTVKKRAEKKAGSTTTERDSKVQLARATPIVEAAGKVASVNPGLRFVVIDFAFNPVPQVDQRLAIYRQGQKVGEVKISNQARNSIVAADITAGEARIGDEVRPQ